MAVISPDSRRDRGEQIHLDVNRPPVDDHRSEPSERLVELDIATLTEEVGNRPVDLIWDADRVDHQIDIQGSDVGIVGPIAGEQGRRAAADDRHRVGEASQHRPELEHHPLGRDDRGRVVPRV